MVSWTIKLYSRKRKLEIQIQISENKRKNHGRQHKNFFFQSCFIVPGAENMAYVYFKDEQNTRHFCGIKNKTWWVNKSKSKVNMLSPSSQGTNQFYQWQSGGSLPRIWNDCFHVGHVEFHRTRGPTCDVIYKEWTRAVVESGFQRSKLVSKTEGLTLENECSWSRVCVFVGEEGRRGIT